MKQTIEIIEEGQEQKAVAVIQRAKENHRKLMKHDAGSVFPIQATHRKELKRLKATHIGELRTQLRHLKNEKYTEYLDHHSDRVKRIQAEIEKSSKAINKEAKKLNKQLKQQKLRLAKKFWPQIQELQKQYPGIIGEHTGWEFPLKSLRDEEDQKRFSESIADEQNSSEHTFKVFLDESKQRDILKQEFNEKYAPAFEQADDKIEILETQFEEAILFGDLEVAKQIYYTLKEADAFLAHLQDITFA